MEVMAMLKTEKAKRFLMFMLGVLTGEALLKLSILNQRTQWIGKTRLYIDPPPYDLDHVVRAARRESARTESVSA